MPHAAPGVVFEFGDFRLDCGRFELVRGGDALRVERKPLELLILLVSRQGQLVTRAEIAQRLWSSEVFVDTEHGINTAIRKLRYLLRDDSEEPKFIQTVTGMGYRFIAAVVLAEPPVAANPERTPESAATPAPTPATGPASDPTIAEAASEPPGKSLALKIAVAARFVGLMAAFIVMAVPDKIAGLLHHGPNPPITSLAVIPLDNLSGDPSQEYFADGMTDELITMLAKDSNLRIISRTSVMQYKGAHRPLPPIARALNADGIVEGSVSRANGRVHLNLQLIRADTDTHLWADSYDRDANDAVSLPDEAARSIAERLHSAVTAPAPAHSPTPDAHDAYLRGRYFLEKREADKSAAYFHQAIDRDPAWSQAYSGLAGAIQSEGVLNMIPPGEATTKGEQAARHAIDLDPQNGEAYSTLGLIQAMSKWQWTDAEQNLKRGIALSPGSYEGEFYYVLYLDAVNRPREAVAHMRKALEFNPGSFLMNRHLGSSLYFARQYDEALVHLNQAAEMEPGKLDFVRGWQSRIYEMQGIRDKAVDLDVAQVHNESPASSERFRAIYKRNGWNAYWEARMQFMLERRDNFCVPYEIAVNYIRLGKPDPAFPYLNRAVDQQCWQVEWIMVDPLADKIRTDPRYAEILKRMNLPH